MSDLRPPESGSAGAPAEGAGAPPADEPVTSPEADGASAADATPPPASSVPPPPATPPPGPGETPPPPAPPPPVDLSAAEDDGGEASSSPPLAPPPAAPPTADEVDEPPADATPGQKRSWTPVFLVLLALSVGVGAYFGFRGADDDGGGTTSTTAAGDGFEAVHDREAGFTVAYPKSWGELAPASGEQRLLVSAGGQNYFQVKVRPIDPATVETQIAEALAEVRLITEPRQFTLNGVPTYYFLYYTPVTEQSPVEGVHAHYFMINGDQLYTMVFQALPTDQFSALAPTFDRVAESFQLDEPVTTPSTTAGATSTTAG